MRDQTTTATRLIAARLDGQPYPVELLQRLSTDTSHARHVIEDLASLASVLLQEMCRGTGGDPFDLLASATTGLDLRPDADDNPGVMHL